jgi:hypothetical protein
VFFVRRKQFRKPKERETIKLSQFVMLGAVRRGKNPSVNNLEMLPEHQAKFISNSISLASTEFIISNASFYCGAKKGAVKKVFRFLANLVPKNN